MSPFKKLAIIGALSAALFLGGAGVASADGGHDHDKWHNNQCWVEATHTIDLNKCPMILTSNGWLMYPNQYNPYFSYYNPYFHWYNSYYWNNWYNWGNWNYGGYPVHTHWH